MIKNSYTYMPWQITYGTGFKRIEDRFSTFKQAQREKNILSKRPKSIYGNIVIKRLKD